MSVTETTPVHAFNANGVTTVFNFLFQVLDSSDLRVQVDGQDKIVGSEYTVSGVGNSDGGNVTFLTAPPNGARVVVFRDSALARKTDYQDNGDFRAATVNSDFDRIWLALQEMLYGIQLAPTLRPGSALAGAITLPDPGAGKYLRWNLAGTALEAVEGTGTSPGDFLQSGAGAVARSVQSKLGERFSVMDFGATGNGVDDDSMAFAKAFAALPNGGRLCVPNGRYVVAPQLFNGLNKITLEGDGKFASVILMRAIAGGITWELRNSQWCELLGIGFSALGQPQSAAGSIGVSFTLGSCNNAIDNCAVIGFGAAGLRLAGTLGNQQSGNVVRNCYLLGNGGHQFDMEFSNDFHVEDNQFGSLDGVTHASSGAYLSKCGYGIYDGNFHWNNGIGAVFLNCAGVGITGNRLEESDTNNLLVNGCDRMNIAANRLHTASQVGSGIADNMALNNVINSQVTDNYLYSWNATTSRYGIGLSGDNSNISFTNNKIAGYSASYGPIGGAAFKASLDGDCQLAGNAAVPTNTTIYVGHGSSYQEGEVCIIVPYAAQVVRLYAAADAQPGSGYSFTYTLRKNVADTALTTQLVGVSGWACAVSNVTPPVIVSPEDTLTVRITSSAGAAPANHRWYIDLVRV